MTDDRKNKINTLKKMFDNDEKRIIFKKFIEYIRFPFFKNFEKNLKVNFNFPITFIVGQNGGGKSSLLHALYGVPKDNSVGEFWYSTDLDPIENLKHNRHCFIYSYKTEFTKTSAEILKTRIKKTDFKTGKTDPDYWEPSRPLKKYGMLPLPNEADNREATKTRWKVLEKNVYFLDFRYSLSAYDKFYYSGQEDKERRFKKKEYIRNLSGKIKYAFENGKKIKYYSRIVEKPIKLSDEEIKCIQNILNKSYQDIQITEHNLYDKKLKGFTVIYKLGGKKYSEAYAGSGETAVVKLVHDLIKVQNYSLVLLDEPETSLHPSAQKKLMSFILEQIIKKKLQVIISTHSPDIIESMPFEAIKILYENIKTGKTSIRENVFPENAFAHIGRTFNGKKVIIVEDKLAKMIINAVLKKTNDFELFDVVYFPGGASQIKQNEMTVFSKENDNPHFIIFDGDQKKEKIKIELLSEIDKTPDNLKNRIHDLTGEKIKFSFDSNASEEQKTEIMLKYIKYYNDNVFFLPRNIPEEIIWNADLIDKSDFSEDEKKTILEESDYKRKYALFAKFEYGSDTANDIESIHKKFINRWIKKENKDYKDICQIISIIKKR